MSTAQPASEASSYAEVEFALRPGPSKQLLDRRQVGPLVKSLSGLSAARSWFNILFNWGIMLGTIAVTIYVEIGRAHV